MYAIRSYYAIAASIVLVGTIAYHFYQPNEPLKVNEQPLVLRDTVKVKKTIEESTVVTNEKTESIKAVHPAIKAEASQIIEEQVQLKPNAVALEEPKKAEINAEISETSASSLYDDEIKVPVSSEKVAIIPKMSIVETASAQKRTQIAPNYNAVTERENLQSRKLVPLILLDGQKISEKELDKVSPAELDSIVLLKEPLYIINGVEYSEQEIFSYNFV